MFVCFGFGFVYLYCNRSTQVDEHIVRQVHVAHPVMFIQQANQWLAHLIDQAPRLATQRRHVQAPLLWSRSNSEAVDHRRFEAAAVYRNRVSAVAAIIIARMVNMPSNIRIIR